MAITPLPNPPLTTDNPVVFNTKAFAWVAALGTFTTETNALANDVSNDADAADTARIDAQAAAASAVAAAGATKWVSGTTYAEGAVVWSPITFLSYRRKTAGSGTTDPSLDSTNWAQVAGTGDVTVDATQTLTNKTLNLSSNTLVATSAQIAAAVTDETGTGALVFATSPTLVTPVLGTPASGTLSGCTVDGTNAVGFRNIPQNSQSAAYTLVLDDAGKHILHPSADTTARTFTIPANGSVAYPIGTAITFINQNGAGVVTIAITTDTMRLAGAGTTGSRTLAANGVATAIKVTSTEWIISGVGLT
jgi:hypothetical protein